MLPTEKGCMKTCTQCKEEKALDAFCKYKRSSDGRDYMCATCRRSRHRQWRADNPEKNKALSDAYRERNADLLRAKGREKYQRRKHVFVAYRKRNAERIRAALKQWRKDNPDLYRDGWRKGRFRKHGNPGSHTTAQWRELCDRFGNQCLACGATNRPLQRDHIIPVALGGSDDIENIQPLCASCNRRKQRTVTDYRPELALRSALL